MKHILVISALLLVPFSVAYAHRPIFSEKAATDPHSAVFIAQPAISQVIYREITDTAKQIWLALDAHEGFKLFIQIGVPVLDHLKDFRPAMTVIGPGLPEDDLPFALPEGWGAKVFSTADVKEPRFFHEHFTGTDSWILLSETVVLPSSGRYYGVAYVPSGENGKLWLSVGQKESFGLADWLQFGEWKKRIREFHEVSEEGDLRIPIISDIGDLLTPAGKKKSTKGEADSTLSPVHKQSLQPVKVFLLAGQSNMEGQGVVSYDDPKDYNGGKGNLVNVMKDPAKAHLFKHLKDEKRHWVIRKDVKIVFRDRSGGLTVGYTGYGGSSHIGPELQFGHVVGNYFEEPVLLIKTAWGGKSLYKDFRPPSSGGKVGEYYKLMLKDIHQGLDSMEEKFPAWKGRTYEISGFVWMQGWNDMCDPKAIPEYDRNLINLVKDLREEFQTPDLPIVIGELGNGGPEARGNMVAFREAQKRGAEQITNAAFVITHDFSRDPQESPNVGHGHHWFGNAESYFLIGDALGKGMVRLIEEKKP